MERNFSVFYFFIITVMMFDTMHFISGTGRILFADAYLCDSYELGCIDAGCVQSGGFCNNYGVAPNNNCHILIL